MHDYLVTPNDKMQARIRKRGQNGTLYASSVSRCRNGLNSSKFSVLYLRTAFVEFKLQCDSVFSLVYFLLTFFRTFGGKYDICFIA